MWDIFQKEFKSYFHSASGYIFMIVFLVISGLFFSLANIMAGSGFYNEIISNMTFIFLFLVPIITMKMISNETREKTDQLLLTSPLRIWEIVIGKFFAATALFFLTVSITFIYPVILKQFGRIAIGEIVGGYIGFLLMGMCFIAIGLFISSLTDNQVTAAVGTFGALFFIWIVDWIKNGLPTTIFSGAIFAGILVLVFAFILYMSMKNIFVSVIAVFVGGAGVLGVYIIKKSFYEGFIVRVFGWLSLLNRYKPFDMGVFSVTSAVYYITFTVALIYLTMNMIDKRRWS